MHGHMNVKKKTFFIAGVEALSDICNRFTEVWDSSLVSA